MLITKSLKDFLSISKELSHSTILITDCDCILYQADMDFETSFQHKKISSDLKDILKLYKRESSAYEYLNTSMNRIIPIIDGQDTGLYLSQIILPIVQNGAIKGLLIFMSKDREYIDSNLAFAKTTKQFVEFFCSRTEE